MATKRVLRMGNPTLRKVSEPLSQDEIVSNDTKFLLKDMYETMMANKGIGIAAPQIGVLKQVALVGIPKGQERYKNAPEVELITVINPVITVLDKTKEGYWEGCLSVPKLRGYVERPQHIKVEYYNTEGEKKELEAEGFVATVFQHEVDHLFGKLFVDRITDPTKLSYLDEYLKYVYPFEEEQQAKENTK